MTFILHPLSHYNTIIEPHASCLLSLIEDHSIDFPSHFILSFIDLYKDTATHDKLIFPSAITWLIRHFLSPIPSLPTSPSCVPLTSLLLRKVLYSFTWGSPRLRRQLLQLLPLHPPLLLLLHLVEWHLRPSWYSLCTWMLALILLAISCVRWTPVSVISGDNRLWWVVT